MREPLWARGPASSLCPRRVAAERIIRSLLRPPQITEVDVAGRLGAEIARGLGQRKRLSDHRLGLGVGTPIEMKQAEIVQAAADPHRIPELATQSERSCVTPPRPLSLAKLLVSHTKRA